MLIKIYLEPLLFSFGKKYYDDRATIIGFVTSQVNNIHPCLRYLFYLGYFFMLAILIVSTFGAYLYLGIRFSSRVVSSQLLRRLPFFKSYYRLFASLAIYRGSIKNED